MRECIVQLRQVPGRGLTLFGQGAVEKLVWVIALTGMLGACAGGLVGGKERKHAYFDKLEQETLARLTKEQPKAKQELAVC